MEHSVSIIIPNYNGRALLEKNLPSVFASAACVSPSAEVIVVDDGSSDDSAAFLRSISRDNFTALILEKNVGFSGAVFAGAKAAKGEIIYLLNSDIRTNDNTLPPLMPYFDDPLVFAVTSMAYDGKGERVISNRAGITWRLGCPDVDRSLAGTENGRKPGPTLFASGGHSAYRRLPFIEVGGFDPLYSPFYFEDVDLCWRAWKRGWKILFEPESTVRHDHQSTIGKVTPRRDIETIWRRNRLLFTWRNITDGQLLTLHILTLPLQIIAAAVSPSGLRAFVEAAKKLKDVAARRRKTKSAAPPKKDADIYRMFRETLGTPAVCYFGAFNTDYPRNEIIRLGLERHGIRTSYCTTAPAALPVRWLKLAARFVLEHRRCGTILVGEGRHLDAPLARALGLLFRKRVILDAFISHYDTWVLDRAKAPEKSLRARFLAFADRIGPRCAHKTLLDTETHIDFYSETFRIPRKKFLCIRVGADDTLYKPAAPQPPGALFRALFFGSFLPLHGADTIIRAAEILEKEKDIVFDIVGDGDTFPAARKLCEERGLKNVTFHPLVSKEEIARMIAACDIALGIFGTTGKAARVIPNKNYQALAMRKPVITMDSPAARELLIDGENALLCPPADPQALADCILTLHRDAALRDRIAANGYNLFLAKLTPEKITEPLLGILKLK